MIKKRVLIVGIFFCAFLGGMDRLKNSFPKLKDSPKGNLSPKKFTESEDGKLSPKIAVDSMEDLKGQMQRKKDEKKQSGENKRR